MFKTLILVPVVMACATVGTIGLIHVIKKVQPDGEFKEGYFERKVREQDEKKEK